jgi:cell division septation protein DedD
VFEPDRSINYLADASGLSSVKEPGRSEEDAAFMPPAAPPEETTETTIEPEVDSEEPVVDPVPEVGEPISETRQTETRAQKPGLPPALRWVAYTVVPLLVIIIILAFNFRFFFGEGGLFRGSDRTVETEQVVAPQPVTPAEPQPVEETPAAPEEVQPEPFDPTVQPPRPETGRPVYYIIAGSFENEHQAEAFAEDLRRKGAQTAGIYMRTPAGFYRVSYGYYYDLHEAENQLPKVQQDVNPNAWILHR